MGPSNAPCCVWIFIQNHRNGKGEMRGRDRFTWIVSNAKTKFSQTVQLPYIHDDTIEHAQRPPPIGDRRLGIVMALLCIGSIEVTIVIVIAVVV